MTLRLATASSDEGRLADMIRRFAQDVTAASDGSIVIEPVWSARGRSRMAVMSRCSWAA